MRSFHTTFEGRKPLRRPGSGQHCNIKMDVTEIRWEDVDWIHTLKESVKAINHRLLVENIFIRSETPFQEGVWS